MSSRFVTRAGRDAPKYVQALLKQSSAAPVAGPTSGMLMRSSSQHVAYNLASLSTSNNVRFFSDKTAPPPPPPPEGYEEILKEDSEATPKDAAEAEEATVVEEQEVNREAELEAELKAAKDQLLRSLAEAENTRRIAKRDVSDARNFAVKSFAKSLLDTADNLSRALEVVPEEMRKDKENHATLATLYEGIEMTETGLLKAFESNGLKKFGKVGDVFDPNKHEALYEYPDPEKTPGTVGQLIKNGFMLNDRVLRPAEVGVVKKE